VLDRAHVVKPNPPKSFDEYELAFVQDQRIRNDTETGHQSKIRRARTFSHRRPGIGSKMSTFYG
jgi:hypothetical protein